MTTAFMVECVIAIGSDDVTPIDIAETPEKLEPWFTVRRAKKARGAALPSHAHDTAQLTYAARGMVQIHTDAGVWLVPPQRVAWVPAGMSHRLDILTDAELWMVYWRPAAVPQWASPPPLHRAFVSQVTPLLAALLAEAVRREQSADKASLVMQLVLHELAEVEHVTTFLPLPASATGKRVVEHALQDHQHRLDLAELAARAATSVRTISRLFPAETGLSFKAWRQRARIIRAMDWLCQDRSIASVARRLGFRSTAAFSHAFRQVTGRRPGDFVPQPPGVAGA